MTKFFSLTVGVIALALTLGTPAVSEACGHHCGYGRWGYGYGHGCGWSYNYRCGCGCYGYYYTPGCCYASSGGYVYPMMAYSPSSTVVAANTATIQVTVPAGAKVYVDGNITSQTGAQRNFESPQLAPGTDFSYDLKVVWHDKDGTEVTQTRRVAVRANASISVNFGTEPAE
jgi:uncharacterized protein (TIGR03000 family)